MVMEHGEIGMEGLNPVEQGAGVERKAAQGLPTHGAGLRSWRLMIVCCADGTGGGILLRGSIMCHTISDLSVVAGAFPAALRRGMCGLRQGCLGRHFFVRSRRPSRPARRVVSCVTSCAA